MTDINLKTLTPDTSLPTTGFLFGADSQASTNPSVYSTQTVATTLLGSTSLTGTDPITTSAPLLNLTQAWNSSGTTFTGLKFNVDTTTYNQSAAASLLMDLQVGAASKFSVSKAGVVSIPNTGANGSVGYAINNSIVLTQISAYVTFKSFLTGGSSGFGFTDVNGSNVTDFAVLICPGGTAGGVINSSSFAYSWTASNALGTIDTLLTRRAAANLRFGAADAASPVAQKLSVQSVVAGGGTNTAGQDFTITGSQGTGSGVGGSIIFQTAAANSGGGAGIQNTLANAMVIDSVKTVRLGTGYTVATLPAAGTAGRRTYVTDALAPVYLGTLTGGGAVVCPVFDNGTAWVSA